MSDSNRGAGRPRNASSDRTLDTLLLFDREHPVLSASYVASQLGVARSTAYRYLESLTASGLVTAEDGDGGFRLGPHILALAQIARHGWDLTKVAVPFMKRIADQVDETVIVTRLSGDRVVCLEREDRPHRIRLSYERGDVMPLNAGAAGLILLAWQPEDELRELIDRHPLPRFTKATITDPAKLRTELAKIRRNGYYVAHGQLDPHAVGISVPIRGAERSVVAGLAVAAPDFRMNSDRIGEIIEILRGAADEISAQLTLLGA
ncbi:IclR family transcriptional regulator [Pendulispora rubella]|uniref:IclR family transcriptional regulator n=1 Tax=Pendulispora rubella TaxID=2741070 RepID=A0ABZ2L436_9BACT